MNIKEMYEASRPVQISKKKTNKYIWAVCNNIIKAKYFDINDTFRVQTPLNDFVRHNGAVLLVPNIINKTMVGLNIRSLENGRILKFDNISLPYGIGSLRKDFKYGDPIFVVEGLGDYAAIKLINKDIDVLTMQTNEISRNDYSTYTSLTNNIVLIPDADERGRSSAKRMKYRFRELGVTVNVINQYGDFKDTGDLLELVMQVDKFKGMRKYLQEELRIATQYYKLMINRYREV